MKSVRARNYIKVALDLLRQEGLRKFTSLDVRSALDRVLMDRKDRSERVFLGTDIPRDQANLGHLLRTWQKDFGIERIRWKDHKVVVWQMKEMG